MEPLLMIIFSSLICLISLSNLTPASDRLMLGKNVLRCLPLFFDYLHRCLPTSCLEEQLIQLLVLWVYFWSFFLSLWFVPLACFLRGWPCHPVCWTILRWLLHAVFFRVSLCYESFIKLVQIRQTAIFLLALSISRTIIARWIELHNIHSIL